jgi:hypothetical protein
MIVPFNEYVQESTTAAGGDDEISRVMEDPNFVNSVLMSLPGVDPNDERIKVQQFCYCMNQLTYG